MKVFCWRARQLRPDAGWPFCSLRTSTIGALAETHNPPITLDSLVERRKDAMQTAVGAIHAMIESVCAGLEPRGKAVVAQLQVRVYRAFDALNDSGVQ